LRERGGYKDAVVKVEKKKKNKKGEGYAARTKEKNGKTSNVTQDKRVKDFRTKTGRGKSKNRGVICRKRKPNKNRVR